MVERAKTLLGNVALRQLQFQIAPKNWRQEVKHNQDVVNIYAQGKGESGNGAILGLPRKHIAVGFEEMPGLCLVR